MATETGQSVALARHGADNAKAVKLAMLQRFSQQMLATARRYSDTLDDADDAYQRAAEILLTRGPASTGEEMCRWLRTTVKHEAIAIRRQRQRMVLLGEPEMVPEPTAGQPDTHERAERLERLRLGAQALGRLKPQEVRCLVLKAQGYTYNEICERTGFSYTKVDRCLKEGRSAFAARLAGIESGDECARIAPLLSALADGEATPEDIAQARPHLRGCLPCRARLREYRAVPSRVAALAPPAAVAAGAPGDAGPLRALAESVIAGLQDRVAMLGDRAHQAAELATGQKVAAVAASAAVLAGGGGAGVEKVRDRSAEDHAPAAQAPAHDPAAREVTPPDVTPPSPPPAPTSAQAPVKPTPPPPEPSPANEFAPDVATASAAAPAPPEGEFASGGGGAAAGRGEFGP